MTGKYIDVWEVSDGATRYVTDSESDAVSFKKSDEESGVTGLTLTRKKMERAKFNHLPEFYGF